MGADLREGHFALAIRGGPVQGAAARPTSDRDPRGRVGVRTAAVCMSGLDLVGVVRLPLGVRERPLPAGVLIRARRVLR